MVGEDIVNHYYEEALQTDDCEIEPVTLLSVQVESFWIADIVVYICLQGQESTPT